MSGRRVTDPLRAFLDQVDQVVGNAAAEVRTEQLRILLKATESLATLFVQAHPGVALERVPVSELLRWAREELEP